MRILPASFVFYFACANCFGQGDHVVDDKFVRKISGDYIKRLESSISFISNKDNNISDKNFQISRITDCFVNGSTIEVSSKNRTTTTKYSPRRYFEILRDLRYIWVDIKFDLNVLKSLKEIKNGVWMAEYEIHQHFKGQKSETVTYYDYTIKSVEVYVFKDDEKWNVKFGNIKVVKTI